MILLQAAAVIYFLGAFFFARVVAGRIFEDGRDAMLDGSRLLESYSSVRPRQAASSVGWGVFYGLTWPIMFFLIGMPRFGRAISWLFCKSGAAFLLTRLFLGTRK